MAPPVLHMTIHSTSTPSAQKVSQTTAQPAILSGFSRHRVIACDYPAITPDPSGSVRGLLVTGLNQGDLHRLDKFEGDEYSRVSVEVAIAAGERKGEMVTAQTYVWIHGEDKLEKREWDFEEFKKEKMQNWTGTSKSPRCWVRHHHGVQILTCSGAYLGGSEGEIDPTGGRAFAGKEAEKDAEMKQNEVLRSAV